jgi:hypothetical protein
MNKIAADEETPGRLRSMGHGIREDAEHLGRKLRSGVGYDDLKSGISALRKGGKDMSKAEMAAAYKQVGKGGLRAGLAAGAVGAAGYGAKKLHDAHKKESSALDQIVEARALELLEAATYEKVAQRTATEAAKDLLTARHVRKNVSDVAGEGAGAMDKIKAYAKILRGKAGNEAMTSEARKSLAAQAGLAAGVGAAGYGAKKLHDAHKKESSAFEELALVRAYELLEEAEAENELDEAALGLLRANGYDV